MNYEYLYQFIQHEWIFQYSLNRFNENGAHIETDDLSSEGFDAFVENIHDISIFFVLKKESMRNSSETMFMKKIGLKVI